MCTATDWLRLRGGGGRRKKKKKKDRMRKLDNAEKRRSEKYKRQPTTKNRGEKIKQIKAKDTIR